ETNNSNRENSEAKPKTNREETTEPTTSDLPPTPVSPPSPANISLAPGGTSQPGSQWAFPNGADELQPDPPLDPGFTSVGQVIARRGATTPKTSPQGPPEAQKTVPDTEADLQDLPAKNGRSEPNISTQPKRKRGRPRKTKTEYLDAVIQDFSAEFHDAEHLPSNLSQARHLLTSSRMEESYFVQNYVYPARSVTRDRGNIQKYAGEVAPLRNKMPYFFAVLRDLLGMHEDEAGPRPPMPRGEGRP